MHWQQQAKDENVKQDIFGEKSKKPFDDVQCTSHSGNKEESEIKSEMMNQSQCLQFTGSTAALSRILRNPSFESE